MGVGAGKVVGGMSQRGHVLCSAWHVSHFGDIRAGGSNLRQFLGYLGRAGGGRKVVAGADDVVATRFSLSYQRLTGGASHLYVYCGHGRAQL